MKAFKKYLPDVVAVVVFALISFAYFMPADLEGRILYQHDSSAGRGMGHEQQEYYERTGQRTRWTNSVFSGMPTYQIAPSYKSTDALGTAMTVYHLGLPENVWYVFVYLLGFYILLRAFDFRQLLAALGAIVWAFSSYFFIIIAAGHIWKVMALAYLPPMIAGVVLAYRGKYLWGLVVTALFTAFEVKANHVQMTYYFLFVILFMVLAFLVQALREHKLDRFVKATLVCMAGAAIGISINLSNLYHTWQYGQQSMRGKSELVKKGDANQTGSGLDRNYITQWSYGIGETWTLLIPNAKGGSHNIQLQQSEKALSKADPQYQEFLGQWYQYWGEQPFTAGPVYVGAFVLMLFILGLFIVKGPMKWALLAATVLSVLLSWGRNFMPFTDFFIDYVPMYSKFRTVSSILVIAEFTIPLLAMLALKEIVEDRTLLTRKVKYVYASFGLTAGFCLLFALFPTAFFSSFVSTADTQQLANYVPKEYLSQILDNLGRVRQAIFTADCWRSFWIIVIGTALLLLYKADKLRAAYMVTAVAILCLVDMWQVDKRYLNDAMFVEKSVREAPQQPTATDRQILQDKSLDYRVLNMASNTFNENETSYYHKSIGGYHAAKLHRYQDMIDAYIVPEMQHMGQAIATAQGDMTRVAGDSIWPVLNMLNTKYVIMPLEGGRNVPIMNPYAYGNAWFVDKLLPVGTANEEIDCVGKIDLRHEAVYDRTKFTPEKAATAQKSGDALVTLKAYEPNELRYEAQSASGGYVVFSEIYYPGWTATLDGQPASLFRADYILRAMYVPAGKHDITLTFKPTSIRTTETVAYVSYVLLIVVVVIGVVMERRNRKKQATEEETQK